MVHRVNQVQSFMRLVSKQRLKEALTALLENVEMQRSGDKAFVLLPSGMSASILLDKISCLLKEQPLGLDLAGVVFEQVGYNDDAPMGFICITPQGAYKDVLEALMQKREASRRSRYDRPASPYRVAR